MFWHERFRWEKPSAMFQTFKLARLFGVDIYLHWTLWPLLIWLFVTSLFSGGGVALVSTFTVIAVLFASVLVHELGHSLAARSVNVRTKDIVLMPVGGIARLEGAPFLPNKELWISFAGPAVNLLIACSLLPFSHVGTSGLFDLKSLYELTLVDQIIVLNFILGVSNLLPALPLDGGRVFRSIVAMKYGHLAATQTAARLSRWIGVLIIGFAAFNGWFLLGLAFGLYLIFASTQELWFARVGAARQAAGAEQGSWAEYVNPFAGSKERANSSSRIPDTVDAIEVKQI